MRKHSNYNRNHNYKPFLDKISSPIKLVEFTESNSKKIWANYRLIYFEQFREIEKLV